MYAVSVTPEVALEGVRSYSGGLGILEGDKFLGAAKRGMRYLVLTLLYRGGYVDYAINKGKPEPRPQEWRYQDVLSSEGEFVVVVRGEEVGVRAWSLTKGSAKAVFFEAEAPAWAARFSERLYIEDGPNERNLKYVFLAKAAAHYLREVVGLENVKVIDLQEAYTAMVPLALREFKEFRFITHTPGPWGHPTVPAYLLREEFGYEPGEDPVNLTILAARHSKKVFTVSRKHYEVTTKLFPQLSGNLTYVTNGVFIERYVPEDLLNAVRRGDPAKFREARGRLRKRLLAVVREQLRIGLENDERPIIVWARRLAPYKRPDFPIRFIREHPDDAVYVLAGKPHPHDRRGIEFMREFIRLANEFGNVAYVHKYDLETAKALLTGADILLFTPFSGWEACGTSYMKSMAAGVPVLASRDGGVLELIEDGVNGWLFGQDLRYLIPYDSVEASEINERDYEEFSRRLEAVIRLYGSEEYVKISMNASRTALEKADISLVLKKYYGEYGLI